MKLIAVSLLLAILPAFQASPKKHKYTGPNCLGHFCFEGGSKTKLSAAFGRNPRKGVVYCYKTSVPLAYVQYQIDDEYKVDKKVVTIGMIAITDFPDCAGTYSPVPESSGQISWKTPDGIGLGSSEQEVVHAYGEPAERESVTAESATQLMMLANHIKPKEVPPNAGDTLWTYKGDGDLSIAWILFRHGKVSGIRLSDVE